MPVGSASGARIRKGSSRALLRLDGTALRTEVLAYAAYLLGAQFGRGTRAMDVVTWILGAFVVVYVRRLLRDRKASAAIEREG